MSKKKFRELHIGDSVWTYRISYGTITIWSPYQIKRYTIDAEEITGNSYHKRALENDMKSRYDHQLWDVIGPGDVKKYIEENLIEGAPS